MLNKIARIRFFIKNSRISLLVLRLSGAGMFFLSSIFITNYYSIETVSDFEFFHSTLLLLGSLVLFGTDVSILQIGGKLKSENRMAELKSLYLKSIKIIFFATITLVVIIAILFLILSLTNSTFLIKESLLFKIIGCLFFYAICLLSAEAFRIIDRNIWTELYHGIFRYGILFMGVFPLFYFDMAAYLVNLYLISFVMVALISFFHFTYLTKSYNVNSDLSMKAIAFISFPMSVSSLSFFILLSADVIILKLYGLDNAVSIYAQPLKIIAIIIRIKVALEASYAVDVSSNYFAKNSKALQKSIKSINRKVAMLSLPLLILFFILAEFLLSLFGTEYVSGSFAFYILLVGVLFNISTGCTGIFMNMTGKQKALRNILLITAIINVLLNVILIPIYGITGAAFSSMVSVIIWNLSSVIYIYKKDKLLIILH